MKYSSLVLSVFAVLMLSSFAFAALQGNGTITNVTITPFNYTAGANTTYYIQLNTSLLYGSAVNISNISITFPTGTLLGTAFPVPVSSGGSGSRAGLISGDVAGVNNTNVSITNVSNVLIITFVNASNATFENLNFSMYITGINTTASFTNQTTDGAIAGFYIATLNSTSTGGWGSSSTGTQGTGVNGTRITLLANNPYNITTYSGNAQTITVGNQSGDTVSGTTYTNITALVQDRYGNFVSKVNVTFAYMNESTMTTPSGGILNSTKVNTTIQASSVDDFFTNATGHASIGIVMANSTANGSNTYMWNASVQNNGTNAKVYFNETAAANAINYFLVAPSTTTPTTGNQFTVLISAYDQYSNINGTSSWAPSLTVTSPTAVSMWYNLDGTTTYTVYSTAVTLALSSGNVSVYAKVGSRARQVFTVTDTNSATGAASVIGVETGGGSGSGSGGSSYWVATATPTPSATTPTATPAPTVKEKTVDSSTGVKGSFSPSSASFDLTYTSVSGFYGDLKWTLPFNYADYTGGKITITPAPASVKSGSLVVVWNNVDLAAGEAFKTTVSVSKYTPETLLQEFKAPILMAKEKPAPAPTAAPTVAPTEAPTAAASATSTALAVQPDYTLWLVVIIIILALAYYWFAMRGGKKKGL